MNRKKNKSKKLSPAALQGKLFKQFYINPKKRYNSKQLIQKLRLNNNRDSVDVALKDLAKQQKITAISEGRYKLNKANAKANPIVKKKDKGPKNIYEGKVDMTRSGSAFILVTELENDIFVAAKNINGALNGDIVNVSVKGDSKKSSGKKMSGKIVDIVKRSQTKFIGKLFKFRKEAFVEVNQKGVSFEVDVSSREVEEIEHGNIVKFEISSTGKSRGHRLYFGSEIVDLGSSLNNDTIMREILYNNGFAQEFPEDLEKMASSMEMVINEETLKKRRDFREILTVTIDPDTARDFDDAISYQKLEDGNFEVGVHIADVTHYLQPNTVLDDEAYDRATSVYLVDRVAPMLPEILSNDLCSLNPNEDKLCFSAVFTFNKKMLVTDRWFGKTIIHSDRRFTYEEAQERIISGDGDLAKEIRFLNKVAKSLRAKRFKNGSISFHSEELKFKLDENGKPIDVYVKESFDAHKLVEDFMLLANREVGQFINKKAKGVEIPFVYRIHDQPDIEKLKDFALFAKELGVKMLLDTPEQIAASFNNLAKEAEEKDALKILEPLAIRTMAKAEYSTDNIGHYGLGFEDYAHFTSPIRRYADVLVHRILEMNLEDRTTRLDKDNLEARCKHISAQERKAVSAERESIKYKQVEWAEGHLDQEFDAYISGMIDRGLFVTIQNSLVEGMIGFDQLGESFEVIGRLKALGLKTGNIYKMGDKLKVKITSADLEKRQIELELITD
ncbi:ribonuclease R [Saprospiraceae bacterium]|nr:ribonuclease R [Saprospiraceae bacterium]